MGGRDLPGGVTPPGLTGPRVRAASDAATLAVATAASGIASYVFVAIGTRGVGAAAFAPVSVLWTLWSLTAATVTFPVQHWIIREVAASGREDGVWARRGRALGGVLALSALWAVVATVARDDLFPRHAAAFVAMSVTLPLGSLAIGTSRGVLAARSRFRAVAAGILGENLVRVTGAALVVGLALGVPAFGLALLAGFAIVLAWPRALVPPIGPIPDGPPIAGGPPNAGGTSDTASGASPMMAGMVGGMLGSQVVLTSGTVVVGLVGGSEVEVTSLFTALALVRAPYVVTMGVATRLTRPLTRMVTGGRERHVRRLELALAGTSVVAAAVAALLGPAVLGLVMPLLFGDEVAVTDPVAAMLAAGGVLAVTSLVQTVVLIARGRTTVMGLAWVAGVVAGAATLVAVRGTSASVRVSAAFVVAEVIAWLVMVLLGHGPAPDVDTEGPSEVPVGPGELARE